MKLTKNQKFLIKALYHQNDNIKKIEEYYPELTKEQIWSVIYEARKN